MRFVLSRAFANAPDRLDSVDHIPKRQFRGRIGHDKTAVFTALRPDEPRPHESLHELGEIGSRNMGDLRDLLRGTGLPLLLGDGDDGAQRVFDGMRDHDLQPRRGSGKKRNGQLDLDIYIYTSLTCESTAKRSYSFSLAPVGFVLPAVSESPLP